MTVRSPLQLFLLFFRPVLELPLHHTNINASRAAPPYKPFSVYEMRCWLACRLEMTVLFSLFFAACLTAPKNCKIANKYQKNTENFKISCL